MVSKCPCELIHIRLIFRNLWGVLGGVMIIGSAFGIGWVARDILCSNFFRPLGKITFCVYLCHPFILKASMGNLRQPLFLSDMTIVSLGRFEDLI